MTADNNFDLQAFYFNINRNLCFARNIQISKIRVLKQLK